MADRAGDSPKPGLDHVQRGQLKPLEKPSLMSRTDRKIFGKRRATRWRSWLAVKGQPSVRLGALVFRLRQIRKSHSGLVPQMTGQDPDSRLCVRPEPPGSIPPEKRFSRRSSSRLCRSDGSTARSLKDQKSPLPGQFNALQPKLRRTTQPQGLAGANRPGPLELPQLSALGLRCRRALSSGTANWRLQLAHVRNNEIQKVIQRIESSRLTVLIAGAPCL